MKEYSSELIFKYITGDYIDNIDELEDNPSFMIDILKRTKDMNIYNLCSNNLKTNYYFLNEVIDIFKYNRKFISDISNYYLDNEPDYKKRMNIIYKLMRLTLGTDFYPNFSIRGEAFYIEEMVYIELALEDMEKNKRPEFNTAGLGFFQIIDEYNDYSEIKDYFAKRILLDELFKKHIDLELKIHEDFNSFGELEEYGIKKYLINLINLFDSDLGYHISMNTDILKYLDFRLKSIKRGFKYISPHIESIYQMIFEEIHTFYVKHENELIYSESELMYIAAKEIDKVEELKKYDSLYPYPLGFVDAIISRDNIALTKEEKEAVIFMKKTIKGNLRSVLNYSYMNDPDIVGIKPDKSKILEFKKRD